MCLIKIVPIEYFQTNVAVSMYVMARNPQLFPNPDCFRPERWLTENPKIRKLPQDVFFGFGPRMCLGMLNRHSVILYSMSGFCGV